MSITIKFFITLVLFTATQNAIGNSSVNSQQTHKVHTESWSTYKHNGKMCPSPPNGFEIIGDFDGNKKKDVARLQMSAKGDRGRLAVWMNDDVEPIILDQQDKRYLGNYLNLQSPGKYTPYINSPDQTSANIEFEAISYGTCEASEVIYYWSTKEKKFKKIWTSD